MKTILHLVIGFSLLGFAGNLALAQSLQMSDLPGYALYKQADELRREIRRIESPEELNWDTENGVLYFNVGDEYKQVDLKSGKVKDVEQEPKSEQPDKTESTRRSRQRVGRAQQRTKINSPDGNWRALYRNYNVHLEPTDKQNQNEVKPRQVTRRGEAKFRYGTACWVYGEELSQQDAMWFSPDSTKLAFYEIDERHMKTYYLTQGNTQDYTKLHKEQYPIAGEKNPHVALLVYDLNSKQTVRIQIDGPPDQYLYNVRFSPDGSDLLFNRTNRWQNNLDVIAADVDTGHTRTVVSETQETWQKNSPLMRFLKDGQRFIWETERTGWKHFELRNLRGERLNALTEIAEYPCESIIRVDEDAGWLYYTAYSGDNPLNVHLHRVKLDGSNHSQLTQAPQTYSSFNISPDHLWFTARKEAINTPPSYSVYNMRGREVATLVANDRKATSEVGFPPTELFSFTAADGETTLYGTLHKPRNFDPNRTYPLLIDVYGGPLSRGVSNRYSVAKPICEFGFLVAKIGNRGTVGRGKAFESANYLKLGGPDLQDQAHGVRYLAQRSYVDGSRVGIFGHSYGGYMSALALLKYPDTFHVGVAGAPVTDWRNYDTIYTERYMRLPDENPRGYDQGSCLKYADNLKGKLFILHGLVDDNVHPTNTWELVRELQKANKRFDLMVYPNNAHGFRYSALRWDYFIRHLDPQPVVTATGEAAGASQ